MELADPVIGSERPAFEIGEDAVDPRQDDMCGHFADDFRLMVVGFEALVSRESVAEDRRAGRDRAGDEGADAGRGEILQRRKADSPGMAFRRELDRADKMQLSDGAAALAAGDRVGFGAIGDVAFVDFDDVFQEASVRIDHGAAKLLQHQPGSLVGAEVKLRLQLQR